VLHIVQIVPFIGPGTGVAGVAWNLERQFVALGHTVERFSYRDVRGARARRTPRTRLGRRLLRARRMLEFSLLGTRAAREFLASRPDAVSVCHSEALAGDVFVSHGIETVAVRTRARGIGHLLINPVRAFTYLRERTRYRSRVHRAVVVLSDAEASAIRRVYRRVAPRLVTIPNGVDLERFHPPTSEERRAARAAFRLDDDDRVALLIGHDLVRKGLTVAVEALARTESVLLLVVGGDADTVDGARARAAQLGVAPRVLFAGTRSDIPFMMAASDIFILPSAYEANALVVLEALAAGLPVIATRVGYAPEIIEDGTNGFLVEADPGEVALRLEELVASDRAALAANARASAVGHGWRPVAEKYVALLTDIHSYRSRDGE
jgi:UDP-glucose:(heptosyl)LPS alpha-1,3-glucosyltransferase